MTSLNQLLTTLLIVILGFTSANSQAEQTGMPGDNLSLEGVLELFKKSKSPEHFEELLNKEENQVNNLDLNGDGDIDYIRVVDQQEGDLHAITLQIPISKNEAQDVAVIAIEKNGKESATLQIIGDEEIYGEEKIVEPFSEDATSNEKGGPSAEYRVSRVVVNVWLWPSVRYVYRPVYRPYVSPWYWGYYPGWWKPWRPISWRVYSPRISTWRIGFRVTPTIRVTRARRIYTPRRTTSVTVVNRYKTNKTTYVSKKKTTSISSRGVASRKSKAATTTKKTTTTKVKTNGKNKAVGKKKTTKTKVKKGAKDKKGTKVKKTKTKKVKKKK